MKVIKEGIQTDDTLREEAMSVGICTEEPGDNCWLQLD